MEIIDISVPISDGMLHYPGDPGVRPSACGGSTPARTPNLSKLDFGLHSGTHVDAPLHFLDDGDGTEAPRSRP